MFVVAGVKSGAGKTVLTLGLMEALRQRGLVVAPFKAGPDYIDPALHARVLGRPSYNLDTWMMGEAGVRETFLNQTIGAGAADVAVVEGVMGLFDGKGGKAGARKMRSVQGSTAHLAKVLGLPVLLVVDASGMAASVGALVKGFSEFDPDVMVMGVVFNRVASERHALLLDEGAKAAGVRSFGAVFRDEALELPSRHLGLVWADEIEKKKWRAFLRRAARTVESSLDIDLLLKTSKRLRQNFSRPKVSAKASDPAPVSGVKLAVARDPAFSFYYQENLDILRSFGAEMTFFSPISDAALPKGTEGLYLGGGYPELYAGELEANITMREDIKRFSKEGGPILAECGGLLYLGKSLATKEGDLSRMAGVFPWQAKMLGKRSALGYREVKTLKGLPFLRAGARLRGHEFHYSKISGTRRVGRAFERTEVGREEKAVREGFLKDRTLATYFHLHFASNPAFARGFLGACRKPGSARK